jgi:hypothetical protein
MNRKKRLGLVIGGLAVTPFIAVLLFAQGYPVEAALAYINNGSGWAPWSAVLGGGAAPGFPLRAIELYCKSGSTIAPCNPVTSGGVVTSFNTRTGAVVPASGDYTAAQVTNALDVTNTTGYTLLGNLTLTTGKSLNTPIIRDGSGTSSATLSGARWIFPGSGIASNSVALFNGTDFSGGTGTTTWPMMLFQPTGTTSSTWNTAGTYFGVNAASGFAGNLMDLQVNGVSQFLVSKTGSIPKLTIGAGQAMTAPPEMLATKGSVLLSTLNNVDGIPFTPISPVTITRVEWQLSATATGCTTNPIATVMVNSVASAFTVPMTIGSFFGHVDSTLNVPAGNEVQMKITTASAGCTPTTSSAQFVIHYLMQ